MQDAPGSELLTILDMLNVASRSDGRNQCGGKGAGYLRSLGCGRTLASLGTEEGDLPASTVNQQYEHWALRFNTLGAKRMSSSVDRSIPRHQWVRLKT